MKTLLTMALVIIPTLAIGAEATFTNVAPIPVSKLDGIKLLLANKPVWKCTEVRLNEKAQVVNKKK